MRQQPDNPLSAPKTWGSELFGLSSADVAPFYAAFERVFGRPWLETASTTNRVLELWRRNDTLAGLEVAAVGSALLECEKVDAKWVGEVAQAIRRTKGGGEHGLVFELLACGMLAAGGMPVTPSQKAMPGQDAELVFEDGYRLRMSFKSFGISDHETTFQRNAAALRARFRKIISRGQPMRLSVQGKEHLEADDFEAVAKNLRRLREEGTVDIRPGRMAANIRALHPEPGELPFSPRLVSDQCIVICKEHANEQARFGSKLRNACLNMAQYCKPAENTGNFLLVRLHPAADSSLLFERAKQLVDLDGGTIDAIMLYQPAIIRTSEGQSVIAHHVRIVYAPTFEARGHQLKFVAPFGVFSGEPHQMQLANAAGPLLDLDRQYVYQAGDFFREMRVQGGNGEGSLTNPAPGMHEHLVIKMPDGSFTQSAKFPQFDHLRLL